MPSLSQHNKCWPRARFRSKNFFWPRFQGARLPSSKPAGLLHQADLVLPDLNWPPLRYFLSQELVHGRRNVGLPHKRPQCTAQHTFKGSSITDSGNGGRELEVVREYTCKRWVHLLGCNWGAKQQVSIPKHNLADPGGKQPNHSLLQRPSRPFRKPAWIWECQKQIEGRIITMKVTVDLTYVTHPWQKSLTRFFCKTTSWQTWQKGGPGHQWHSNCPDVLILCMSIIQKMHQCHKGLLQDMLGHFTTTSWSAFPCATSHKVSNPEYQGKIKLKKNFQTL